MKKHVFEKTGEGNERKSLTAQEFEVTMTLFLVM